LSACTDLMVGLLHRCRRIHLKLASAKRSEFERSSDRSVAPIIVCGHAKGVTQLPGKMPTFEDLSVFDERIGDLSPIER